MNFQWRILVQLHRCASKNYSYLVSHNNINNNNNNNNNNNDAESNRKLLHLFISSKTATLVPVFAVKDLPLNRNAILVSVFAVKDLFFGQNCNFGSCICSERPALGQNTLKVMNVEISKFNKTKSGYSLTNLWWQNYHIRWWEDGSVCFLWGENWQRIIPNSLPVHCKSKSLFSTLEQWTVGKFAQEVWINHQTLWHNVNCIIMHKILSWWVRHNVVAVQECHICSDYTWFGLSWHKYFRMRRRCSPFHSHTGLPLLPGKSSWWWGGGKLLLRDTRTEFCWIFKFPY